MTERAPVLVDDVSTNSTSDGGAAPAVIIAKPSVTRLLSALFNVISLNAAVLLLCLPIVTVPIALQAGLISLDRWISEADDRVVHQFCRAVADMRRTRVFATVGAPLLAAAVALVEIRFFAESASPGSAVGVGLGVAGLALSLAGLGYTLLLGVRCPDLRPTDAWSVAIWLTLLNPVRASALLVAEFLGVGTVLLRDPALAVIGVPVALLALIRLTAERGFGATAKSDPKGFGFLDDREVRA